MRPRGQSGRQVKRLRRRGQLGGGGSSGGGGGGSGGGALEDRRMDTCGVASAAEAVRRRGLGLDDGLGRKSELSRLVFQISGSHPIFFR